MTTSVLKQQHTSLQFSDSKEEQEHDVQQLFKKGKDFPIKTGTESGPETFSRQALIAAAKEFNHAIKFSREIWVAVDREIIEPNSVTMGEVFVLDNDRLVGHMHDRTFPWIKFTHKKPGMGKISVAGVHYATRGVNPGDPNYEANKLYAEKLAEWMKVTAVGSALAFAGGDWNINDKIKNWAFDENFTSMSDELKTYKNTGHGPIDGFVSYDKDKRVKAKKQVVLDDKAMPMFSDHFATQGTWTITLLKK